MDKIVAFLLVVSTSFSHQFLIKVLTSNCEWFKESFNIKSSTTNEKVPRNHFAKQLIKNQLTEPNWVAFWVTIIVRTIFVLQKSVWFHGRAHFSLFFGNCQLSCCTTHKQTRTKTKEIFYSLKMKNLNFMLILWFMLILSSLFFLPRAP